MSRQSVHFRVTLHLATIVAITLLIVAVPHAWSQTNMSAASATPSRPEQAPGDSSPKTSAAPTTIKPVTVNPDVTTAHLKLFVKPLTVDELEVEAKGWQQLLKENVQEITSLHIQIAQLTEKLSKLRQSDNNDAQQASPSPPRVTSTEPTATAAATKADDANSSEPPKDPETETNTADSTAPEPASADSATVPDGTAPNATIASQIESLTNERDQLSSKLTELTLRKTDIAQKFEVVLSSLELKGGNPEPYRKYNNALTGVALEVTSATGLWQMLTTWLFAEQGGKRWAWNLVRFVVILLVSYFGASILANFVRRGASRVKGVSKLLVNFLSSFTKQLSMVVGFIIGLAALEVDITPLIAAVGAAGFVVAFALQGTLSNFASGLLILAYRPFDVGDVIEAGGVSGNVDSVSLFSTHIRTFDNKLMIVPNNDIWGGTITNATASTTRRVDLVFGIGYSDDIDTAKNILASVVAKHPMILKDPATNIRVNELGDSSVNLICRPWTLTENYWSVYWDLMHSVKQEFQQAGISIPFPQRDVHVYQQTSDD